MTIPSEDVQRAARSDIDQLIRRYSEAADAYDGNAFAACFAEDGTMVRGDGPHQGRATIAAMMNSQAQVSRRHVFVPPVVEFIDEHRATGRGYCLMVTKAERTGQTILMVDYSDVYRLTEEGWRIEWRQVKPSFPADA